MVRLPSGGYDLPLTDNADPLTTYSTFKITNQRSKIIQHCPKWSKNSDLVALVFLVLVAWAIGYSVFGNDVVGLHSQLFSLVVLFIAAKVVGSIVGLIRIPPMVGMLLIGVLLRNVGFIHLTGGYSKFAAILRQLALVNIMLPAGLGLDPQVLSKMKWMIANLALGPVTVEVVGITVLASYILEFPWLWGLLLGLLLAAVSPAVIIPCLFELQDRGYGVDKGVHTMVIAASTFNDIICIALFGVVIGLIFSTGSLTMQVLQGPIILVLGLTYGVIWGALCIYVPSKEEKHLITLRTLLLGLGSVLAALGSDAIGYGGAGALGCIIAAFVASYGWRKQGWTSNNPVRLNFALLWKFFEPISFGLIGMEVNFEILELDTVFWGCVVMVVPLIMRVVTSFFSTQCSNLNLKENVFVALAWIPKATVQAALGPVALDMARSLDNSEAEVYANSVVVIAVVSILVTSPIGAIIIMECGPRLLHKTPPEEEVSQDKVDPSGGDSEIIERL